MPVSALASPSATRAVLEAHGLSLKKSLGQHFLVDDNIVRKIIELAAMERDEAVLEIGPGIGTLTVALCAAAGHVVAVERDADLLPVLTDVAAGCGNLTLVRADAVTVPIAELAAPFGPPTSLVANLPYGVAATVVLRFFQEIPSLRSATVMVQSEVAARMAAEPGRKDYGAYTVKLRMHARAAGSFKVAPGCFMPPPHVDSTVLRLERVVREEPEELRLLAERLAEAAFAQRRKTLRNSVLATTGWSGTAFDTALAQAGIDGRRRAETLSVDEFIELATAAASGGLRG
ncbi:MAG TPA: 16S rRNA (adenine(1518)-N(6)/adenine(1519)-N(6))-dimethyltransferase RsmA [Coriobacteriia bacterium]